MNFENCIPFEHELNIYEVIILERTAAREDDHKATYSSVEPKENKQTELPETTDVDILETI